MSDSNVFGSIFAETAPTRGLIVKQPTEELQLDALRDDLLQSLDEVQPRIEKLKETCNIVIQSSQGNIKNVGVDLQHEIDKLIPRMDAIHTTSIKTSRRIQSLGLNQQTVGMLSIPKQLRPVHDEFFQFKEEFDTSLKNVATLSRSITSKIDLHNGALESLKTIPNALQENLEKIAQQQEECVNASVMIDQLKQQLTASIINEHEQILSQFDEKVNKAAKLVEDLETKADDGLTSTTQINEQIQTEKFDIKNSFEDLMKEIQNTSFTKLDDMKKKVELSNKETISKITDLQSQLTNELEEISRCQSDNVVLSLIDEIEKQKEMSELEALIERFNALEKAIKDPATRPPGADYEDLNGIYEGRKAVFRCFDNGTFTVKFVD